MVALKTFIVAQLLNQCNLFITQVCTLIITIARLMYIVNKYMYRTSGVIN